MPAKSRVQTFLVGVSNVFAVLAVAGFLAHVYLGQEASAPAIVSTTSDPAVLGAAFFESEDFQRHLSTARGRNVSEDVARKLKGNMMSGKGKGKGKKSSKIFESHYDDELDCLPLFPTVAPTKGKGKGKGGGKMMMKKRNLMSSSKGSKGKGDSDSSPAPSFFCPPPLLDVVVDWSVVANGLVNDGGWTVTNDGNTIRFDVEDSNDACGTVNSNIQSGTATGTFTLMETADLTATVTGLGEPFVGGTEFMDVYLTDINGALIAFGFNSEMDNPVSCAPIAITSGSTPTELSPGTYTLFIDFSTGDGAFHSGVFFQTDLAFVPV